MDDLEFLKVMSELQIQNLASTLWRTFDALTEAGFTEGQAMTIVLTIITSVSKGGV